MANDPYGAIARKYPLPAEQRFFALEDENKRLRSALERTLHNFEALLARKPVRDAAETIGEAHEALGATDA